MAEASRSADPKTGARIERTALKIVFLVFGALVAGSKVLVEFYAGFLIVLGFRAFDIIDELKKSLDDAVESLNVEDDETEDAEPAEDDS